MTETSNVVEPTEVKTKKNIRHAEKRRTATCRFANRVAQVSIDTYRKVVPEKDRPAQTCLAAVVVHDVAAAGGGKLIVAGLGVGTKFLGETILRSEASSSEYGKRVRDCHAEVLARRAFRRQLTLEIIEDIQGTSLGQVPHKDRSMLQRQTNERGAVTYRLRPGLTLHFYSSSAPCGNAVLKKFAKMSKETFQDHLGPDHWPDEPHLPISDSSIHLGQFSLLIKKDNEMGQIKGESTIQHKECSTQGNLCLALQSDNWTPPGTTIVTMHHKGSIHTCSDKLARWNYLGLQGSLLSSLLSDPIYLSSVSVGRKFTECICRRAICCRMEGGIRKNKRARASLNKPTPPSLEEQRGCSGNLSSKRYRFNHPSIMGNSVYMDDAGVVETSSDVRGQDVRFHSSKAWCWWPSKGREEDSTDLAECIDGATGYLWHDGQDDLKGATSLVSTVNLVERFFTATKLMQSQADGACEEEKEPGSSRSSFNSLEELKAVKQGVAPEYEGIKATLLSNHPILKQWRRRS